MAAMTRLHAAAFAVGGQELIDQLRFLHIVERRARHDVLGAVARLDFEGEFTARNTYPAPAVAELLACNRPTATRLVRLASQMFPTTLAGQSVAPVLAATAAALASWSIHPDHAEVISRVMSGRAARRLSPQQWAGAEAQCAQWAAVYNPHTLRTLAEALIEQLDQDGDEPDVDADDQVNELHLSPDRRDGYGGHIRGRLDSATYDALAQALDGLAKPREDEGKTLAERRADALGDLAEHALDTGELPECGGERPHLTVILRHDDLKKQLRGGSLTATGCRIGPREIRRLACESQTIALLLSGKSEPLDVGREQRTATRHQRRVLAARDGGCAHPGCDRPPHWCSAHHIRHWIDHGRTAIDNMVLLCRTHHRMIHTAGWQVRIRHGLPEFIPPKWLDYHQRPRQKPAPYRS
jgi:5-methylcytosine-specific restriction protein A